MLSTLVCGLVIIILGIFLIISVHFQLSEGLDYSGSWLLFFWSLILHAVAGVSGFVIGWIARGKAEKVRRGVVRRRRRRHRHSISALLMSSTAAPSISFAPSEQPGPSSEAAVVIHNEEAVSYSVRPSTSGLMETAESRFDPIL